MFPGQQNPMMPQMQTADAPADFSFQLPADPNFELFTKTDVLKQNGFYAAVIVNEELDKKKQDGVWFTFEIQDEDERGKRISKKMPNPLTNPKAGFVWRQMAISIANGDPNAGKASLGYRIGAFKGAAVWLKTEDYGDVEIATSVAAFISPAEYNGAKAQNKHRWASGAGNTQPRASATGLPAGFPGIPQPPSVVQGVDGIPAAMPTPAPAPFAAAQAGAPAAVVPQPAAGGFKFPGMK